MQYLQASKWSALTVAGLISVVFLGLGLFYVPHSDDFYYIASARASTLLGGIRFQYFHWTGRYTAMALHYALGKVQTPESLPYFLLASNTLSLVLLYFAFRLLGHVKEALLFTLIAFTVYCLMGSLSEILYWYIGSVAYQIGLSFCLFVFSGVYRNSKRNPWLWAFLVFLANGMNETFSVFLTGGIVLLFYMRERDRENPVSPVVLTSAVISFLLILFAPGSYDRLATTAGPWVEGAQLLKSSFLTAIHKWLSFAGVSTLAALVMAWFYPSDSKLHRPIFGLTLLLMSWTLPFALTVGIGMRVPLPQRTFDVMFLVSLFSSLMVGLKYGTFNPRLATVATTVFIVSALLHPKLKAVWRDRNAYPGFQAQMFRIYEGLQEKRNARTAEVPYLRSVPAGFSRYTLPTSNSANWTNRSLSRYYSIGKITIRNKEE